MASSKRTIMSLKNDAVASKITVIKNKYKMKDRKNVFRSSAYGGSAVSK